MLATSLELRDGAYVYSYDSVGMLHTVQEGATELMCLANRPDGDRFHAAFCRNSLRKSVKL